MNTFDLTISIPCYNDAESITLLMKRFHESGLNSANIHYLLIDDGSTDHTYQVLKKIQEEYPNVEIIRHQQNKGFGYTIKEAITVPETNYILFISGDYQFREDAAQLLFDSARNEDDYILGIRERRMDNTYRKITSLIYNLSISLLARKKTIDVNSIFIIKRDAVRVLNLKSSSAFIHAEIFLKLTKNNKITRSIEIPHYERMFGKGSGGKLKIIIPTIKEYLRYLIGVL